MPNKWRTITSWVHKIRYLYFTVDEGKKGMAESFSRLLALRRRTLGSERHRYAIAWPDKLRTDPMAYGGLK